MKITAYELKKIFTRPIVLIVIAGAVLLDIYILLIGGEQDEYSANQPALAEKIAERYEWQIQYAGAINDEWTNRVESDKAAFLSDPANLVDAEQEEQKICDYMKYGYTEDEVREFKALFLTEEAFHRFNKFEDLEFSAKFYDHARETKDMLAEYYLQTFPNEKGQTLAKATQQYYAPLINDYTAYYNYDFGYQKFRNILTVYPITVGIIILVGVSGIFCSEYSQKTDSLLLVCMHGKRRLALAKLSAGLIFSLGVWLLVTAVNFLLILSIYGFVGFEAYWQNFIVDCAPYLWNSGQISIIAALTSLFGALYFSVASMTVSVCCKNRATGLILSAVLLLFPIIDMYHPMRALQNLFYRFSPTALLKGISVWQNMDFLYIFGHAVPIHPVIATNSLALFAVLLIYISYRFRRRQVEN